MAEEEASPLEGLKVLDIATLIAGPLTASLLGDFGAEVVKVEHPNGDPLRSLAPFKDTNGRKVPLWWKVCARNKKGITLNLSTKKGQSLLKQLVRDADIVVENFRPGTLERWNLGYETLKAVNPRLILLRISGFGQYGPYRKRPGFGRIAEAMSGLTYITGFPDKPPVHAGFPLADSIAGMFGAFAAIFAVYHRDVKGTGEGQFIDLGLYEPVFRMLEFHYIAYDQLGEIYERHGNRHPYVAPSDTYQTKDGRWVSMTASTPSIWKRLAEAMGRSDLLNDPRFEDNRARVEHSDAVNGIVADWMSRHTLEELTRILDESQVGFGPVFNMDDIASDPHYQARENIVEVEDAELGKVRMQGVVPKFSKTPGRVKGAGPQLGEHNKEIYGGRLGIGEEQLEQLKAEGVL